MEPGTPSAIDATLWEAVNRHWFSHNFRHYTKACWRRRAARGIQMQWRRFAFPRYEANVELVCRAKRLPLDVRERLLRAYWENSSAPLERNPLSLNLVSDTTMEIFDRVFRDSYEKHYLDEFGHWVVANAMCPQRIRELMQECHAASLSSHKAMDTARVEWLGPIELMPTDSE